MCSGSGSSKIGPCSGLGVALSLVRDISCFVLIEPRKLTLDMRKDKKNSNRSKNQVVAVVDALETCRSSFDHELGASWYHKHSEHI